MRLSSKKAAYVVVDESSVVGNPEFARDDKLRVAAHLGSGGGGGTESNNKVHTCQKANLDKYDSQPSLTGLNWERWFSRRHSSPGHWKIERLAGSLGSLP